MPQTQAPAQGGRRGDPRKGNVGQPRQLGLEELSRIERFVDKHPDANLEQMQEKLEPPCTIVTIYSTLRLWATAIIKTLRASKQDRADIAEKRVRWKEPQKLWPAERLVFINESSAKTNLTRLRGRVRAS